jgi:hypothetical protein
MPGGSNSRCWRRGLGDSVAANPRAYPIRGNNGNFQMPRVDRPASHLLLPGNNHPDALRDHHVAQTDVLNLPLNPVQILLKL